MLIKSHKIKTYTFYISNKQEHIKNLMKKKIKIKKSDIVLSLMEKILYNIFLNTYITKSPYIIFVLL